MCDSGPSLSRPEAFSTGGTLRFDVAGAVANGTCCHMLACAVFMVLGGCEVRMLSLKPSEVNRHYTFLLPSASSCVTV